MRISVNKRQVTKVVAAAVVVLLAGQALWAVGGIRDITRKVKEDVEKRDPVKEAEEQGEKGEEQGEAVKLSEEAQAVVDSNNQFALALYEQLRSEEGNLFCSPYSIETALSMTQAGAKGVTASQMATTLRYPDSWRKSPERVHAGWGQVQDLINAHAKEEKPPYQLAVANAIWVQHGMPIMRPFEQTVTQQYGSAIQPQNFAGDPEAAREVINTWIEEKTNDRIQDMLQKGDITRMTRMVLTNAIYFKGTWRYTFDKKATREGIFMSADGAKAKRKLMHATMAVPYAGDRHQQMIVLPYQGDELSMVIVLPGHPDVRNRRRYHPREYLPMWERTLNAKSFAALLEQADSARPQEVDVVLPRFEMTCRFTLSSQLKKMGMPVAFTSQADFSGMTGNRGLLIDEVIHQAFVKLDEEGTEAAAATAVVMRTTSAAGPSKPVFRADRPFFFLIRDNRSGAVLFMGRVNELEEEKGE